MKLSAGVSVAAPTLLLLLAACGPERSTSTATIAPAEPRPKATVTASLDDRQIVTTSGSPPPLTAVAPGTQLVTVGGGGISMRSLVPRGHTLFHIQSKAGRHDLALRGGGDVARVTVPDGGSAVLQTMIAGRAYELVCETPGHDERARFETYVAGAPLELAAPR